jgi:hypothetical protein
VIHSTNKSSTQKDIKIPFKSLLTFSPVTMTTTYQTSDRPNSPNGGGGAAGGGSHSAGRLTRLNSVQQKMTDEQVDEKIGHFARMDEESDKTWTRIVVERFLSHVSQMKFLQKHESSLFLVPFLGEFSSVLTASFFFCLMAYNEYSLSGTFLVKECQTHRRSARPTLTMSTLRFLVDWSENRMRTMFFDEQNRVKPSQRFFIVSSSLQHLP